jgi:hypothetical protein
MGQRGDNFTHAFDGLSLDWTAVFGAGFRDAPPGWVSVFRECSLDEIGTIARIGLSAPSPETRHPELRQEMELLDGFRPPHIVASGISRLAAVYATPTSDTPQLPFRKERVIIEMRVDPDASYVGDMDFITALIPFIGARKHGLENYHGAFRKYWETVIPLRRFKRYYAPAESAAGRHWFRKPSAPESLPRMYFSPEIMVMTPSIGSRHIRIVRHECAEGHDHGSEIDSPLE